MAWGKNGTPDTLTTAGTNMNVSDLNGSKFNLVLSHTKRATGTPYTTLYLNNDNSNNSYSSRQSENGGNDGTAIDRNTVLYDMGGDDADKFEVTYIFGISSKEKLAIGFGINAGPSAGASGIPERGEFAWKWENTSDTITRVDNQSGDGNYDTGSNLTVLGSDITPASAIPFPENVELGSRAEITDTRKIYYRMDSDYETDKWFELGTVPYAGGRGVFSAGYHGANYNILDYVTIETPSNATDFGDLSVSRRMGASVANKMRGVFAGGYASTYDNTIDYITIATAGNATDFGDMPDTQTSGMTGAGSETRGIFAGGETSYTNRMAYITIDTTSNTSNFGNLTQARKGLGSTSDGTKAVFCGGEGSQTTMDYVTIGTTGNAQSWGTFSAGSHSAGGGVIADGTKGIFVIGGSSSGANYSDVIEYITFATTGNSVDFGNLTEGRASPSCCSSNTRGLIGGGKYTSGGTSSRDTIDYITIATTGNATDFGDLTQQRYATMGGVSDTGAVKS